MRRDGEECKGAAGGRESTLNTLRGILRTQGEEVIKTSVSFHTARLGGFHVDVFETRTHDSLHARTHTPLCVLMSPRAVRS